MVFLKSCHSRAYYKQPKIKKKEAALLAMIDSEALNLDDLIQTLGISIESSDLPDDITFLLLKR